MGQASSSSGDLTERRKDKTKKERRSTTSVSPDPTVAQSSNASVSYMRSQSSSTSYSHTSVIPKPEQKVAPLCHETKTVFSETHVPQMDVSYTVEPQMAVESLVTEKTTDRKSQTDGTNKRSIGVNATRVLDVTPYQFFYQGANGEYHGPNTECEMQEWYRRGFFPNKNGTIRLVHGGETQRETTMRQLIEWNGARAPFSMTMVEADETDRFSIIAETLTQKFQKRVGHLVFLSKDDEGKAAATRIAELEVEVATLRSTVFRLKEQKKPIARPSYLFPLLHIILLPDNNYLSVEDATIAISRLRSMFLFVSGVSFEKQCKRFFVPMSCSTCETKEYTSACRLFAHVTGQTHQENLWEHDSGVTRDDVVFWQQIMESASISDDVHIDVKQLVESVDAEDSARASNTQSTGFDRPASVVPQSNKAPPVSPVLIASTPVPIPTLVKLSQRPPEQLCRLPLYSDTTNTSKHVLSSSDALSRASALSKITNNKYTQKLLAQISAHTLYPASTSKMFCRFCDVPLTCVSSIIGHALCWRHVNITIEWPSGEKCFLVFKMSLALRTFQIYEKQRAVLRVDMEFWEKLITGCEKKPSPTSDTTIECNVNKRLKGPTCQVPLITGVHKDVMPSGRGLEGPEAVRQQGELRKLTLKSGKGGTMIRMKNSFNGLPPNRNELCVHCSCSIQGPSTALQHLQSTSHIRKLYANNFVVCAEDFEHWRNIIKNHKK